MPKPVNKALLPYETCSWNSAPAVSQSKGAERGPSKNVKCATVKCYSSLLIKRRKVAKRFYVEWSQVCEIPLAQSTYNCGIAQGSSGTRHMILLSTL